MESIEAMIPGCLVQGLDWAGSQGVQPRNISNCSSANLCALRRPTSDGSIAWTAARAARANAWANAWAHAWANAWAHAWAATGYLCFEFRVAITNLSRIYDMSDQEV